MTDSLLLDKIQTAFPMLTLRGQRYGKLYNVSLYTHDEWYQIDITEDCGVGLTYREIEYEMDFSGSDIAFNSLDEAINFLVGYRRKLISSAGLCTH